MSEQSSPQCGIAAPEHPNLRQRLTSRLFPFTHLPHYPVTGVWADKVYITLENHDVGWADRLRLLITGRLSVKAQLLCQNPPGLTEVHSMGNVLPPQWLEGRP